VLGSTLGMTRNVAMMGSRAAKQADCKSHTASGKQQPQQWVARSHTSCYIGLYHQHCKKDVAENACTQMLMYQLHRVHTTPNITHPCIEFDCKQRKLQVVLPIEHKHLQAVMTACCCRYQQDAPDRAGAAAVLQSLAQATLTQPTA
jgi:hypothetical protein